MPPQPSVHHVDVRLVCAGCANQKTVYLRVEVPVPEPLRPKVQLGPGGIGGGLSCDRCGHRFPDFVELRRLVEEEIRGRRLREHLRNGFVTITC